MIKDTTLGAVGKSPIFWRLRTVKQIREFNQQLNFLLKSLQSSFDT